MVLRASVCAALLVVPAGASTAGLDDASVVRSIIATSVSSRLGEDARITVEVLQAPGVAGAVAAAALPGTRLGMPARFLLTLADGRRVSAVARVTADARHLVAARNVPRNAALTAEDVQLIDGPLDGQLFDPLPSAEQVLGAHARRAIRRGEVITSTVVKAPPAVRAGDPVTMVIRAGTMEVRGPGRAVSSGVIGDVIRVMRPAHREPLRGRIVEPAVVEILR